MIVILWCVLREQNSGLVQETNVFHLILPLPCLFASTPRCYTIHYIKSYSEFLITEVNHVISLLKSLHRVPIVLTSPSYTDLISYNPWCCPLWPIIVASLSLEHVTLFLISACFTLLSLMLGMYFLLSFTWLGVALPLGPCMDAVFSVRSFWTTLLKIPLLHPSQPN